MTDRANADDERDSVAESEVADGADSAGDSLDDFLKAVAAESLRDAQAVSAAAASAARGRLHAGMVIGQRYRLDHLLGSGGMGVVWAATHVITRRAVALKFLKASLALDAEHRRRFLNEARAATAVQHPSIVAVADVFDLDGEVPVIVMELLAGETLGDRLAREQRLSPMATARVMRPVIDAVEAAHATGVVHRDLKPENIFLLAGDGDPGVRVLDFGVAKLVMGSDELAVATGSGATLGTPCYMAPEQAFGEGACDHRVDVWALGAILYECLSGVRPVQGPSLGQVVVQLKGGRVTPLSQRAPELPARLCALVDGLLAPERDARPSLAKAASVLEQLVATGASERGPAASRAPKAAAGVAWFALALLMVAVGIGYGWTHSQAATASRRAKTFDARRPAASAAAGPRASLAISSTNEPLPIEPEAATPAVPAAVPQRAAADARPEPAQPARVERTAKLRRTPVRTVQPAITPSDTPQPALRFAGGLAEEAPY